MRQGILGPVGINALPLQISQHFLTISDDVKRGLATGLLEGVPHQVNIALLILGEEDYLAIIIISLHDSKDSHHGQLR